MNYHQIIDYLEQQTLHHGIDAINSALTILDLKIDPKKVILVAGTNGKGTTAATLQSLLCESDRNIGFFSSPHLEKINERIKFNCTDITDHEFCDVFKYVYSRVHHLNFSYFEYLTLMAAHFFFRFHFVDYAIFEVGLGGLLDATNAIPHDVCVITRLGMDHESILGSNIEEIAKNKLGIIGKNSLVFHTPFPPKVEYMRSQYDAVFVESCDFSVAVNVSQQYPIFKIDTAFGQFQLNLAGQRAAENTALAITVFNYLVADARKYMRPGLKKVHWPGRMERAIYKNRDIFLSGDHNPQGIMSLLELLGYYRHRYVHFVVGICHDKNHSEMLDMLIHFPRSKLYLTETTEKPTPLCNYGKTFLRLAECATADQFQALDTALSKASPDDLIIVTGSLYLVGYIRENCHRF
jgi:dihydrofolate synthase/folylpolyglutamate synthase